MSKAGQGNVEPLHDDWFFALTTKRLRRTDSNSTGLTETIHRWYHQPEWRIRTLIRDISAATLKRAVLKDVIQFGSK